MNTSTSINDQITTHFGTEHRPDVFKMLESNEMHLEAIWRKYQAVMKEAEIDLQAKELIGLSVAIARPSEYMIGLQQRRIRLVGVDDVAENEALGTAAFFGGLGNFAHALHVETYMCSRRTDIEGVPPSGQESDAGVSYIIEADDPEVSQIYEEIRELMGLSNVPSIFKAMAHQPEILKAKWDCYKAVILAGVLPRRTKELIGLAVSAVNGCSYCAEAHVSSCRQLGVSEKGLVEAASVIDLFAILCTLAKGFRLGARNS